MPKLDTLTKKYLSDHERFSDLFNSFVFNGRQIVKSGELQELNPAEDVYLPKSGEVVNRERDILKSLTGMTDSKAGYLILGAENQTAIHYAMPPRVMMYDGLQYITQIQAGTMKKKSSKIKPDGNEFLSGFTKGAKLIPVITVVVYWGKKKWDAPVRLSEMFDPSLPEEIVQNAEDYRIRVLDMTSLPDEVIDTFQSDLKQVIYFRKYSDNAEKLQELLEEPDSMFKEVSMDAAVLLKHLTNTKFRISKNAGGTVNMCEAVKQMCEKAASEAVMKAEAKAKEELARADAKAKEELAKAKKEINIEAVKKSFALMTKMDPAMDHEEICRRISEEFGMEFRTVKRILS